MLLTFRWFGEQDPVTLDHIRQIPGVGGIVSALYDVPAGEVWQRTRVERLAAAIEKAGLNLAVIESIPVHEDIKLGRPSRDRLIEHFGESVRSLGAAGIPVLCYNFMPVFDWMRTDLALRLPDGSTTLAFDERALQTLDLSGGTGMLPGWATGYDAAALQGLLTAYAELDAEQLWEHLAYFLERVIPVAEESGVRMGLHPDDPPWQLFGLPRIITNQAAYERLLTLVPSPANGITFCTGSLAACPENEVPAMARRFAALGRIHFAHCRNVRVTGPHCFYETPHPSAFGDVDMAAVLAALHEGGFRGPLRPDHGRMIWGETGRPGYGLYDRALGAMYLAGLWEGLAAGRPA